MEIVDGIVYLRWHTHARARARSHTRAHTHTLTHLHLSSDGAPHAAYRTLIDAERQKVPSAMHVYMRTHPNL